MTMPRWWNGRHEGLKSLYPQGCESSTLSRGTIDLRGIAQLVERAVWDREVGGSSPLSPTKRLLYNLKIAGVVQW